MHTTLEYEHEISEDFGMIQSGFSGSRLAMIPGLVGPGQN